MVRATVDKDVDIRGVLERKEIYEIRHNDSSFQPMILKASAASEPQPLTAFDYIKLRKISLI